ncbi:MAG: InlB B-repeat-containing protein [Bifidobacteriaceae bacterium]|nr:InlB B-repeat-containing protein [Bifidobacteriaceae bacterium]
MAKRNLVLSSCLAAALAAGGLTAGLLPAALAEADITITFDTQGHGGAQAPLICPQGVSCTLPAPVERGWYFEAWFMDAECIQPLPSQWESEGGGFDVDTALFAKWVPGHTVDWDTGGLGTATPAFTVVPPGATVKAPTVSGTARTLEGWYADPTFAGSAFAFATTSVTADLTLHAKWAEPGGSTATPTPTPTATPTQTATPTATPPPSATAKPTAAPTKAPGTSNRPAAKPVKAAVTVKLAKKTIAAGQRAKATVTVKVAGLAKPAGAVKVSCGAKSVTAKLKAAKKGKAAVKLPAMAKAGTYKVKATFTPAKGSATAAKAKKSTSKAVKLKVK